MVRVCKVVLLGESAVGKSSLLEKWTSGSFDEKIKSTVGAAFVIYTAETKGGEEISLEFWDTAGQERYRSLAPLYYRNADVAIVVYDVLRKRTYETALSWVDELREQDNSPAICFVGNKVDLEGNERGVAKAEYFDLVEYETSARTGVGMDELLAGVVEMAGRGRQKKRNGVWLQDLAPGWWDCVKLWN